MKRILLIAILALTFCQLHAQWVVTSPPFSSPGDIRKLGSSGATVFAGSQSSFGANGISYTTNNGTSWNDISSGLSGSGVQALASNATVLYAGAWGTGVFRTTNNGAAWSPMNNGLTNNQIRGLYYDGSLLLAGTIGGVFVSTNGGDNWTVSNSGLPDFTYPNSFLRLGNVILLGAGNGVFRSTNGGALWTSATSGMGNNLQAGDFTVIGGSIFVSANNVSNGSVFRSTDAGLNWTAAGGGLPNQYAISLTSSGSSLFVAMGSKVLQSTNLGTNWTDISTGLTNLAIGALTSSTTHLYAGLSSGGAGNVWRRALSEVLSVRALESETVPSRMSLSQNYPNPFNPSTNIKFQIPTTGQLTLKVFDMIGKEIASIASGEFNAGTYTATFDASAFSSGMYFYRLESAGFSKTMKMTLMR